MRLGDMLQRRDQTLVATLKSGISALHSIRRPACTLVGWTQRRSNIQTHWVDCLDEWVP